MRRGIVLSIVAVPLFFVCSHAQPVPKNWYQLDRGQDSFYGISLGKAYDYLREKKRSSKTVIVAVLDSGVDTTHEDLKHILWRNPREIPGNGIDDDGNGYIDDVYGWNFLGGKDGRSVKRAPDERSRVYHRWKDKFQQKPDTTGFTTAEKEAYQTWLRASGEMNFSAEEQMEVAILDVTCKALRRHDKVLRKEMGTEEYTCEKLEQFQPQTRTAKEAKLGYLTGIRLLGISSSDRENESNASILNQLEEYVEGKKLSFESKDAPPRDPRADIVKDDYGNFNDRYYGNNDVMGPTPMHGTHVAGLIGAERNNGIGIDGVADNVKLMILRVVPDGDEYDKDVALAIRYAVDNGAKVINMSFGKYFSPEKMWVDSAVKYAESKDVLIVHASGNEGYNLDVKTGFPNPWLKAWNSTATNFINVGASSDPKITGTITSDFSNYGRKNVDVYAPGVKMYSTLPGTNEYGNLQGTSMSAPVVTGIAAMLRSYYPELTAMQVKKIIEQSVLIPPAEELSLKPGGESIRIPFGNLSRTGGIANAYNAVQAADQVKKTMAKEDIHTSQQQTNQNNN